jgi:hypothetical protein
MPQTHQNAPLCFNKTYLTILIITIITVATWWGEAMAYSFTEDFKRGSFWSTFPITMAPFVATGEDQALLQEILDESEEEWESVLGQEIWDIAPVEILTGLEGNSIRWSNDFGNETGYDPQQTLAITVRYTTSSLFTRTEIILNGSLDYLRENRHQILKKTILHELGHTIGLDHSDHQAIMAPYISGVEQLQLDDHAGIKAIFEETEQRQIDGVSTLTSTQKNSLGNDMIGSCGTVAISALRQGGGGGGGNSSGGTQAVSFALSLLLGLLASTTLSKGKLCLLPH